MVAPTLGRLYDKLVARGIEVWRDEVGSAHAAPIAGSTVGAMADAIEKSAIVLCFVSKKYKESANCRLECE